MKLVNYSLEALIDVDLLKNLVIHSSSLLIMHSSGSKGVVNVLSPLIRTSSLFISGRGLFEIGEKAESGLSAEEILFRGLTCEDEGAGEGVVSVDTSEGAGEDAVSVDTSEDAGEGAVRR